MDIKTPQEIETMAEGGKKLARVLTTLKETVRAGMTTLALDKAAHALIIQEGAEPAFLNYRPAGAHHAYPYTLCASVNAVVVHGQPSGYVIRDGDVVKLDLGLRYKKFYLDAAVTVIVGSVGKDVKKMISVTEESLYAAIKEARLGKTLGDIGYVVQKIVEKNKFSVVEGLTGHGIGKQLHEEPTVFNIGRRGYGPKLVAGMVLALEPMVAMGAPAITQLQDESYGTADGSLAAHFEHTVAITEEGPRILTLLK